MGQSHFDPLVARVSLRRASSFLRIPRLFCDEEHAADAEAFFRPRVAGMEGGPRVLAEALEEIRLCAALRKTQEPAVRSFFTKTK